MITTPYTDILTLLGARVKGIVFKELKLFFERFIFRRNLIKRKGGRYARVFTPTGERIE